MHIDKKNIIQWKIIQQRGDIQKLSKLAKVSTMTIHNALNQKKMEGDTVTIIEKFIAARIKKVLPCLQ